jgi:uncharacterized protein (UPF0335 family)
MFSAARTASAATVADGQVRDLIARIRRDLDELKRHLR